MSSVTLENDQLISIIIPCYNYANYLPGTLSSLINQTYKNWECIIVDDGSTDDTEEAISKFLNKDPRFRYIHQENKGPSVARNKGIKAALGAYIQFLDGDDLLEPKKLEIHSHYLDRNPQIDIVYSEARYFPSDNPELRFFSLDGQKQPWMPKTSGVGKEILGPLIKSNIMVISSPLLRRKAIEICGLFDENLKSMEDWDYWLRCALGGMHFHFLDIPDTFALIRIHQKSLSQNKLQMFDFTLQVRNKLESALKDEDLLLLNHGCLLSNMFDLAEQKIRAGQKLKGLKGAMMVSARRRSVLPLLRAFKILLTGTNIPGKPISP